MLCCREIKYNPMAQIIKFLDSYLKLKIASINALFNVRTDNISFRCALAKRRSILAWWNWRRDVFGAAVFCTLNDSVCVWSKYFYSFWEVFYSHTEPHWPTRQNFWDKTPNSPGKKKERKTSKKPRQILSKNSLQPTTHFKPSISLCTQSHPVYSIPWPPQEGCVLHIIFLFMIPVSIVAAVLSRVSRPFPAPLLHLMRLKTTK